MIRFLTPWPRVMMAALLIGSLPMCKKHVDTPVSPDDIVETEQPDLIPVTKQLNDAIGGYYIALPKHYDQTRKNYPILFFFHGLGQTGNGSSNDLQYLLTDGIFKVLADHRLPPSFTVNGKTSSLIVVCPQYDSLPTTNDLTQFMIYIMHTYRGDQKRLYVSGLSNGARITTFLAGTFAIDFAAIVPISGVAISGNMEAQCKEIAADSLPVWVFHNQDDPLANLSDAQNFVDFIKAYNDPVPPRMTIFNVYGHDAWTTALDPTYKEDGKNIYEWMLQYSR